MKSQMEVKFLNLLLQLTSIGFAAFLCTPCAYAQGSLVGTYTGSFAGTSGGLSRSVGITLEIATAENGKLTGKIVHQGGVCPGEYLVDGTYEGAKLDIKVAKGGRPGCGDYKLDVSMQGNKLVGKAGAFNTELSKQ